MTLAIDRPEVEALIQQRLQQGGFKDPQDVIFHALHASEPLRPTSADGLRLCAHRPPKMPIRLWHG